MIHVHVSSDKDPSERQDEVIEAGHQLRSHGIDARQTIAMTPEAAMISTLWPSKDMSGGSETRVLIATPLPILSCACPCRLKAAVGSVLVTEHGADTTMISDARDTSIKAVVPV